jgi:hypothetical protein
MDLDLQRKFTIVAGASAAIGRAIRSPPDGGR